MASLIPDFEYDIFISYRHKDNEYDGWVTEFVEKLNNELKATFKEDVSIYFDQNPDDGLLDTHQVSESLEQKIKAAVFIPIVSQTYCDPKSFAWGNEFIPFVKQASTSNYGLNIQAKHGNVCSRVLPIKIHELDPTDEALFEQVTGGIMRGVDFIYKSAGVNRPLRPVVDDPQQNSYHTVYRDQINKVANTIKLILEGMAPAHLVSGQQTAMPGINVQKELKERRLYKVALVYVLSGLLLWKIAELSSFYLTLPEWMLSGITIGLIVLFPLAISLAWFFEKTPTGFALVGSEPSKNNPLPPQQRKPLTSNYWVLLLAGLLLVVFLMPWPNNSATASNNELDNKSIAVLYFDNMSGDPEQEYFSDGVTEEIIARLAKIEGIKVISRTSTRVYKGKPINLKKIAEELGVSAILEGSFRKSGNQIKVTAQLINAETDEHIWAETFTRELKDVFQIQAEIAQNIASKFEVDITPETDLKITEIPTKNLEAYEYFLRGKHIAINQYYNRKRDTIAFDRAKIMYETAIELDSSFADAYAGLGDLYDAKRNNNNLVLNKEEDSLRRSLSDKAISLAPNSSWVNNTRSWVFLNNDTLIFKPENIDSGFHYLKRALELDPYDAYNIQNLSAFYGYYLSQYDKGFRLYEIALSLDPMNASIYRTYAYQNYVLGNITEAEKLWTRELETRGEVQEDNFWPILFGILNNKTGLARALIERNQANGLEQNRLTALLLAYEGKADEAIKIIRENDIRIRSGRGIVTINLLLKVGMKEEVLSSLDQYRSQWNNYQSLKQNPIWDPYRGDPDFIVKLEKARIKYEDGVKKYGPYVDQFLKERE